ncbi:MAG: hypothetical protein LBC75_03660 [Fibromonadaceae bacterium]|jgi:uncharacterized protein (TIGR02145 family)|nr:hypothetical protein [Fibromonadaceae bacterium]
MKKFTFLLLLFACLAFAQKNAPKNIKPADTKGTKETQITLDDIKGTFTDFRENKKYKTLKLGGRVWMAEDLNYKKSKLFNFDSVQKACPSGWRLPSKSAWEDLKKEISEMDAKLKAKIGWGTQGKWWAATNIGVDTIVYYVVLNSGFGGINKLDNVETANFAVRCIQNIKAKPSEKKNDIKLYNTVKIGSGLWMAENLNYKTGKSWCYENDDYNCNIYGRLYDWNTAIKACPSGWHLPTRREWSEVSITEFSPMLGGSLSGEYSHAVSPNEYKFLDKEKSGNWWGIAEYGNNDAYSSHIKTNENNLDEKITNKSIGYSVRCVQNIPKTGKTNDVKQYKTVKIGNQVWMAENMNYKTSIGKSWCFEDDDFYCQKYGRLYDWNTAAKVCPVGWHLPSDSEWNELEKSAGKGLAAAISALKGGWRDSDVYEYTIEQQRSGEKIGRWRNLEENGFWWTSTIFEATGSAQARSLSPSGGFSSTLKDKSNALSVLCIQNPPIKKISKIFTDTRDSRKYNVIKIGNTMWMANNLNYNAKGSFCYNNKPENCDKYGRLYDWDIAQTVCPSPWRLSSNDDWQNLIESSGGDVARKLKSKEWGGWDNYGFTALPGGFTKSQGFAESGEKGYWWTSDVNGPYGKYKYISTDRDNVAHSEYSKSMGLSVRCVMDCGYFNCVME